MAHVDGALGKGNFDALGVEPVLDPAPNSRATSHCAPGAVRSTVRITTP
jgi:hypothetical protein